MLKKAKKSKTKNNILKAIKRLSFLSLVLLFVFQLNQIEKTNSFFSDQSDIKGVDFSTGYWVAPQIGITSPTGGEVWQVGSVQNIAWTINLGDPLATVSNLNLEYSCDNGSSYTNISSFYDNPGNYNWVVPENISDECQIQITVTDSHNLTGSKESDNFEISWMVVLNEFVPDPIGKDDWPMPGGEWVELYNNGNLDIDVNNWYLYDNNDSHELKISKSNGNNDSNPFDSGETIVPAGGHLVVFRNFDSDFALNNNGSDSVRLFDGEIKDEATLVDFYDYTIESDSDVFDALNTRGFDNMLMPGGIWDETWPGKSFARFPDGVGAWYDPVPTPGDNNSQSLEVDDFKDFFEEWCLDKKGDLVEDNPSCDINLLTALGLLRQTEDEKNLETSKSKNDELSLISDVNDGLDKIRDDKQSAFDSVSNENTVDEETVENEEEASEAEEFEEENDAEEKAKKEEDKENEEVEDDSSK